MNNDKIEKIIPSTVDWLFIIEPLINQLKNNYIKRNENKKMIYKIYEKGINPRALKGAYISKTDINKIKLMQKQLNDEYPRELKDIFHKFIEYIDPNNLEYCLQNIKNVDIHNNYTFKEFFKKLLSINYTNGAYFPAKNKIDIYNNQKKTISHEFLHMASCCPKNPNLCGFNVIAYDKIYNTLDSFGIGLNEGYTELLNQRIFFPNEKTNSYTINVRIVKLLECFFDDYKDMEYAYFHNDIDAVYKAFCQYGTRKEFFTIMNMLDNFAQTPFLKDTLDAIIIEIKLYEIIKKSNDKNKITKFENILYEKNIMKLLKNNNFKLFKFENIEKKFIR